MKKLLTVSLTLFLLIACVTACRQNTLPPNPSAPNSGASSGTQPPKNNTPGSDSAASSTGNIQLQNPQTFPDNSNFIGEEKAKQIALGKAGISTDGVVFDRVELDFDKGIWHYEVEFRQGRTEYDVDIKADDGTVLSYESDYDD